MLFNKYLKTAAAAVFIVLIGFLQASAQNEKAPWTQKGVFWADEKTGVEVFLYPLKNADFRLVVISPKEVKVTYHTRINSFQPVDKEIPVKEKLNCAVSLFDFSHTFSRTTIWMSLEFTVDGQKAPELMRTFYNGIFEVVPNEQFMMPVKKTNKK